MAGYSAEYRKRFGIWIHDTGEDLSDEGKDLFRRIQHKRLQVMVHSIIYYRYSESIWTDYQWDKVAKELVVLQEENPELAKRVIYAELFEGFDGSTGMHLETVETRNKAEQVLDYYRGNI